MYIIERIDQNKSPVPYIESIEKIMCLHALETMFFKCLLVYFKLMWNVSELN